MCIINYPNNTSQLVIGIISASITLLAVIVALFKEWFWNKLKKPKLNIVFEMHGPYCIQTKALNQMAQKLIDSYYFRLKIINEGSATANRVVIHVNKLFKKHSDDRFYEDMDFLPLNLKWSNQNSNLFAEIYALHILPSMGKFCDLGHIFEPDFRNFFLNTPGMMKPGDTDTFLFELDLENQPFTGSHLLKIGTYRIELKIAAENCKPLTKNLILNFLVLGLWILIKCLAVELGLR